MKTSIALIGFMASGKTTVGQILAAKLNKRFIELDRLIEKRAGKSIPEIFAQDGEIGFRDIEIAVTKEIAGEKDAVIACGGGVILNRINIDRLKKEAVVVYLTASPGVALKRSVTDKNERPLLKTSDQLQRIRELLKFRKPLYERAADITINTSRLDAKAVADEIIGKLREDARFHF